MAQSYKDLSDAMKKATELQNKTGQIYLVGKDAKAIFFPDLTTWPYPITFPGFVGYRKLVFSSIVGGLFLKWF